MPTLNNQLASHQIIRELIYGPAKSKKTWWAGNAAEAGFQVFILDANRGSAILSHLSEQARERVFLIDIADELTNFCAATFVTQFLKGQPFAWHEGRKSLTHLGDVGAIIVKPRELNRNCVLVLDSWTDIVTSLTMHYYTKNNIDIATPEEIDKRNYFGWTGTCATWMAAAFVALPCHVILIGHHTRYEKVRRLQEGNKIREIPVFERRQIVSTSGPNAGTIPGKFDEVMYFYRNGSSNMIEVEGDKDSDGGSRRIPPKTYRWEDLQFAHIAAAANVQPDPNLPLVEFSAITENTAAQTAKRDHGLINMADKQPPKTTVSVQSGGFQSLFANKRS